MQPEELEQEQIEEQPEEEIQAKCLSCQLTCKQPITVRIYKCNYKPIVSSAEGPENITQEND